MERLKMPSMPLPRGAPSKALKQSNAFEPYPLPYRYSCPYFIGYPLPCHALTKKEDAPRGAPLDNSYLSRAVSVPYA